MGWAKYEEDNFEALTERWTAGNHFAMPNVYSEKEITTYTEQMYRRTVTITKEEEGRNEANIV